MINAKEHVKQCEMNGQQVVEMVKTHGDDQFIHVVDVEPIINSYDRMKEEIAELKGALLKIRMVSMRTPELGEDYTHEDVGILDDRINEAFGIAESSLAKLNQEGEG